MKDKRRNSEKRKEKSRDAARCRRTKETEVFFELANSLPLPASVTAQLDKASVMRTTISFLKIWKIREQHNWADKDKVKDEWDVKQNVDHLFPKSLDGFVFILSREGDIVYISESVSKYLGIQQIELMGQSILDYVDPRDEDEVREALSHRQHGQKTQSAVSEDRVFFLRMKCTLTSKGRNVNLKSATYKVIKCTGRLVMQAAGRRQQPGGVSVFSPYLIAIGEPIAHPANIEIPLDSHTFLSKHDMDMRFTYCDERVKDLLNYSSEELTGSSLYDYHHALDSDVVERAYKDLLSKGKGQTMTGQYRFLAHGGGWAWVITQATVIYNNRSQKAQWVVCVHYVLSEVERKELILSEAQLPGSKCLPSSLQLSTESIFSPRTKDMEKGYFIPQDMRSKMKMTNKNEPEDLTYLAPTAGDDCIPLGFPSLWQAPMSEEDHAVDAPPSLAGLKIEPGMSPGLCNTQEIQQVQSTLSPASCSSTASSSRTTNHSKSANEAIPDLIDHLDSLVESVDNNGIIVDCQVSEASEQGAVMLGASDQTVPAAVDSDNSIDADVAQIASPLDYVSLASPDMVSSMDKFFKAMDTKLDAHKGNEANENIDFNSRAPYIPMNADDDLCLFPPTPDSMLTMQNEMNPGLFGKTEYVFRPKTEDFFEERPQPPPRPSIRDMICGSTAVASIERPPDTMFQQIKRPLDKNSLEKGPPPHKMQRMLGQQCLPSIQTGKGSRSLLNMLLTGNESNSCKLQQPLQQPPIFNLFSVGDDISGYRPLQTANQLIKHPYSGHFQDQLHCLTQNDCEVNAPTNFGPLLNGQDLINALDQGSLQTPR